MIKYEDLISISNAKWILFKFSFNCEEKSRIELTIKFLFKYMYPVPTIINLSFDQGFICKFIDMDLLCIIEIVLPQNIQLEMIEGTWFNTHGKQIWK